MAEGFYEFYHWAIDNGYEDGLTIDRINTDGNYEPSNCRWATYKDQARNRRNNHFLTFNGETKTATEWAEITGIKLSTLLGRIDKGYSVEKALSMPVQTQKRNKRCKK